MEFLLRFKRLFGRRRRWPFLPVWVERRITPGQPDAYAILAPPSTLKLSISFPDGHPGGTVGFGPEVREVAMRTALAENSKALLPSFSTGANPIAGDYDQFNAERLLTLPPDLLAEVNAWRESAPLDNALRVLVGLGLEEVRRTGLGIESIANLKDGEAAI